MTIKGKAYIAGVFEHPTRKADDKSLAQLHVESALGALADAGLTKADANRALDAFLENVSRSLKKGEKVKLVGFGVFDVYRRKPRVGRDPNSGAPIRIPGRRVTRFTASKDLKATVK